MLKNLLLLSLALGWTQTLAAAYVMEALDRGVVALRSGTANAVSWRWLGTDPSDVAFNVYRNGTRLNATPINDRTFYSDAGAPVGAQYSVRAVVGGVEQAPSPAVTAWGANHLLIPLQRPAGGSNADGLAYTYSPNDASVGDLDGDGAYEIVLKWEPSDAKDNSHSGATSNVILDAYELDGTRLWRIDLGPNIRAGAHYTQFMVYDFDSDGRAELMVKTAPGTRDGTGALLSRGPAASASHGSLYRNASGYILRGPEYLTVFDGRTGAELATAQYQPQRYPGNDDPSGAQICALWGDSYGNRIDRFTAGVAYLDGQRPSAVFSRGYYGPQSGCAAGRTVVWAVDWRGGALSTRWVFDTRNSGMGAYVGKGNHQMATADVDADGRDEVVLGSLVLDDNGQPKYAATWGHGDALHVGDFDAASPGLEIWMPVEWASTDPAQGRPGVALRRGTDGAVLWSKLPATDGADIGRGMTADLSAAHPGFEFWASGGLGLYDARGNLIGNVPGSINFAVWWDGDPLRELLDREMVDKWNVATNSATRLLTGYTFGAAANNGSKSNPALSGDILGDWREEILFRHADNDKLVLFSTAVPTTLRLRSLVHDPQYRTALAWQNVAYNQPPHTSFFIGDGMPAPAYKPITVAGAAMPSPTRTATPAATVTPAICGPLGWASMNGGTSGGGSATAVTVSTLTDLQNALSGTTPRVVYLQGTVGAGVATRVAVGSHKTLLGLPGARLLGGLDIKDADNVIVRNLIIQGPGAVDVDGVDGILVQNSRNVWLDHLEIYDGQDGNLDVVNGSNYVTISWTKFHYTAASVNHQFCNLIGNSDTRTTDRGKLKVTLHHNWYAQGVRERMPRVRYGQVHVVNNLFAAPGNGHCVRAGFEADLLVEGNAFIGVNTPIDLFNGDYTAVTQRNNFFSGTSGNTAGNGTAFTPPYSFPMQAANTVQVPIEAGAGATLTSFDCGGPQPSPTRTASPAAGSPTRTSTLTRTATASATRSATPSATQSSTRSATPSSSPTRTATGTATVTPTVSVTFLETYTNSPTPTASPTGSPTASSTVTSTGTPTRTSSPTFSPTSTASPTNTTVVFSPTVTSTVTATTTLTQTQTSSPTSTRTGTPTASPSATLTANPSFTATPVPPVLSGLSPSGSVAAGVTLTVQGSNFVPGAEVLINGVAYPVLWVSSTEMVLSAPSLAPGSYSVTVRNPSGAESVDSADLVIAGPALTATAVPDGPLVIERAVPWPNPNPRAVGIKLAGPAERVTLKVYSVAWVLVGQNEQGPLPKGWAHLGLPEGVGAQGLYYFVVQAQQESRISPSLKGRFYILGRP